MMSTTSVTLNVPCKLNGSGSHFRSLENWLPAWDVVVWQSWLRTVGTLSIEPCPNFYAWPASSFHVRRRLNAEKLWNNIDSSHWWSESNTWRCIRFYDFLPILSPEVTVLNLLSFFPSVYFVNSASSVVRNSESFTLVSIIRRFGDLLHIRTFTVHRTVSSPSWFFQ